MPVKVERLAVDVGHPHGMLYASDSLYVVSAYDEKERNGLYRLRGTDGDDQFDKTEFLKPLKGQGEHGPLTEGQAVATAMIALSRHGKPADQTAALKSMSRVKLAGLQSNKGI